MADIVKDTRCKDREYSYDEAVELTGHGCYNYLVLLACGVTSLAVAMDMFGFSVVVAAATCDLDLSITATGLLSSTPLAGIIFAFPWGYFADTRGRRRALLLSTTMGFLLAVLTSFAPNWHVMLVLKFLTCIFSTASYTLTITYLGESTGSAHRRRHLFIMIAANLAAEFVFYLLAYLILPLKFSVPIPWLGITLRPWRVYSLAIAAFLGIGALLYLPLYESPKLLASRGKMEKALDVLGRIYEKNGGKKADYPVKSLSLEGVSDISKESFWNSVVKQTVPVFKPPLLWYTLQLFYLISICGSTNNVFLLWYPMMVNIFFNSFTGIDPTAANTSFCDRIGANVTSSSDGQYTCDDTISPNTMYAGMALGLTFTMLNLAASAIASRRRLVLISTFVVSGICLILVVLVQEPITNMIAFTLVQCTAIGVGSVASYFVDFYPTAYSGLATSLCVMFSRLVGLGGVNLVGAVVFQHCKETFYGWTAFVASGIVVAMFLPSDKKSFK